MIPTVSDIITIGAWVVWGVVCLGLGLWVARRRDPARWLKTDGPFFLKLMSPATGPATDRYWVMLCRYGDNKCAPRFHDSELKTAVLFCEQQNLFFFQQFEHAPPELAEQAMNVTIRAHKS